MFNPLEQFIIKDVFQLPSYDYGIGVLSYLSITNNACLVIWCGLVSGSVFFHNSGSGKIGRKRYLVMAFLSLFGFVRGLVRQNASPSNKVLRVFAPYLLIVFLFLLTVNLTGMLPYNLTVTCAVVCTWTVAFSSFVGINIIGMKTHSIGFLSLVMPPGCPLAVRPFIIIIETFSYAARASSLSIRLFANMMSGHTLLKILATFSSKIILFGGTWSFIIFMPFLIVGFTCLLELIVSSLQAYVFVVLLCIYIRDVAELH